ncbi:Transposase [Austwickia chelonae]|uniref:Putative transposase n=1 Tax=Austwickia chelonae NBRC 105200 TaxID=1184607 RepID=K6W7Q0_9MICO|nr:IS110 family transposase [Austwickia chelonae]GAB77857.1 putative transposase [Austwickia chelonae NBRC 105200]SEV90963.1 Transposase [Austwickia chelonae]
MITIGIDPHKASITAVAIGADGAVIARARLVVDRDLLARLLEFTQRFPERRWGVEGASGLGLGVAQALVSAGESVVDVPASLAARARLLSTGAGRKTDAADALAVALVAQHHHGLRRVQPEDQATVMRLVVDHREELVGERTTVVNRLHKLLRELIPGGAPVRLTAKQASELLRHARPQTEADRVRKDLARDLLTGIRHLDARIAAVTKQIETLVAASGTTLTEITGVGPIVAATIIGHTGDITRFPTAGHYASFNGTAPVDASSGENTRRRMNRLGHRRLNSALHIVAVTQMARPSPGRTYYQVKKAESKTPREARRALKRRLSDVIYRRLRREQLRALRHAS